MEIVGDSDTVGTEPPFADAAIQELLESATLHEKAGRYRHAFHASKLVLQAAPRNPDALHLLGLLAFRNKRLEEALHLMQQSIDVGINTPLYFRNIAEVYRISGRLDEALSAGRRAAMLDPDNPVILSNLAIIHVSRGEAAEADHCERAALSLDPGYANAHFGLAALLLAHGDMEQGWEEYEWRFCMPGAAVNLPPHGRPQWDGRPLPAERLLVVADQGTGDVIQFGRYLPWVMERCPKPLIASPAAVRPILAQLGGDRFFTGWDHIPDYDCYVPLSGLPRLAGTRLASIPAGNPYLAADPSRRLAWKARLSALMPRGMLRVGLVWAGRPDHAWNHVRSMHLADLAPLFSLDGTVLVSLQKGERASEAGAYFGSAPLLQVGCDMKDWDDTMAVIANLDVVVSVDTAVAHLAAAMGRRVFLLLPHVAEWRWLQARHDSPWYPTMRLFRQEPDRSWIRPVSSAAEELGRLARRRKKRAPMI